MENNNKMYAKPMYKCAICGETYDNIAARIQCETKCYHQQELEAKKAAEEKKKQEQAARKKEVDEAFDKAMKLKEAYLKDYESYIYEYNNLSNTTENDWLNLKSIWNYLL